VPRHGSASNWKRGIAEALPACPIMWFFAHVLRIYRHSFAWKCELKRKKCSCVKEKEREREREKKRGGRRNSVSARLQAIPGKLDLICRMFIRMEMISMMDFWLKKQQEILYFSPPQYSVSHETSCLMSLADFWLGQNCTGNDPPRPLIV